MSEQTGATEYKSVEYVWVRLPVGFRNPPTVGLASSEHWARLKHGQIVVMEHQTRPGDAVVVTPEIAAVAADACVSSARRFHTGAVRSQKARNDLHSEEMHKIAERYRAAAAALRGEG